MCGRFVDPNLRSAGLDTSWLRVNPFPQRFNIKPTNPVLIVGADGVPQMARWWLIPSWHKGTLADWSATTFNARIEDAQTKSSFRGPWKYGRCVIPMAGYYEWSGSTAKKQPHYIQSAGNAEVMFSAGLMSLWGDLMTCTMMTRAANDSVSNIHTRMPVLLNTEEMDAWLAGSNDLSLGAQTHLRHHPVPKFGRVDDGPELIERVDDTGHSTQPCLLL